MLASWHGFFDWYGWPAFVAFGTILLALVTWRLAVSTRRMAREAGNEARANWRPVLVVQPYSDLLKGSSPAVSRADSSLFVNVHNIGRGPALGVRGFLSEPNALGEVKGQPSMDVAAPDDRIVVQWPNLVLYDGDYKVEILCDDVSGVTYATKFLVVFEQGQPTLRAHHVQASPALGPTGWQRVRFRIWLLRASHRARVGRKRAASGSA